MTVDFLIEREVLDGVAHRGQVADKNLLAAISGNGDVGNLGALHILTLHTHLILLLAHLDRTRSQVEVVGGDGVAHLLDRQTVGVELFGVEVDIDITLRGTADRDVTDAVDAVELVDDIVFQDAVETRITLLGRETVNHNGHGRRVEFQNHRTTHAVGQIVENDIDIGSDIVERLIDILAPLKLEGHHRDIVLGGGGDVFETVDRVQRVLDNLGDIGLNIAGVSASVGRHHRDVGRIHLGHLVDGETGQREKTQHDDGHENQSRGDGLLYSSFVNSHFI